jgi:hypothetical protein
MFDSKCFQITFANRNKMLWKRFVPPGYRLLELAVRIDCIDSAQTRMCLIYVLMNDFLLLVVYYTFSISVPSFFGLK